MSYQEFARIGNEASWGYAFGHRLSRLLSDRGIKVAEFARKTGIPKSTLDSAMQGRTIPNYYRMMLIADGLGITIEKLTNLSPLADLDDLDDLEDEEEED